MSIVSRLNGRSGSIRTQLMVWNILAMAVLLAGFCVLVRYTTDQLLMRSVDHDLDTVTRPLVDHPPAQGPPRDGIGVPEGQGQPLDRIPPDAQGAPYGQGTSLQAPGGRPVPPGQGPPFGPGMPGQGPPPGPDGFPPPPGAPGPPQGQGWAPPGRAWAPPADGASETSLAASTTARDADQPITDTTPSSDLWVPRTFTADGLALGRPSRHGLWDAAAFRRSRRGETLFETVTVDDKAVRIISRPVHVPPGGVVQLGYPLTDVMRASATMDRALLLLVPVVALLAGLGGIAITGRMLERVDRLTQQASRIEENRLGGRLSLSGDDEFARLAGAFNRLLDRLQQAFDRQRALLDQQRRFTADASHELKTPLTVIRGNASVLLGDPTLGEAHRETIQDISGAAVSMTRLVQDLLLLARSDAGQLAATRTTLPLAEILTRAVRLHAGRHPDLSLAPPPPEIQVSADEESLARVFSNLIDNAIRYSPPGARISVQYTALPGAAEIAVIDTGAGIAPEHLPRLGERFYRVDRARARADGGTGLGLAICKEIVAAHGGTITFESRVGLGTTVRVRVPTVQAARPRHQLIAH